MKSKLDAVWKSITREILLGLLADPVKRIGRLLIVEDPEGLKLRRKVMDPDGSKNP